MKKWKRKEIKELNSLEYNVIKNNATEPPFQNKYWDNKKPGIYVDIISGEPLFLSNNKYDSGCGWPSFYKSISSYNIIEKEDMSLNQKRIEVRTKDTDNHLGHVFNDGPKEYGGLRYCINSVSLRFIPLDKMSETNIRRTHQGN
ncbi:peptide-methionine (R)-S-oxide reductase MsrB [Spiroplasma sp. ald]|uniref:peptide-methionine (R)-S-oxide reductase MsrB n=1 Tax=Spiroplasma sp. ald TaxID=2490849 RepID=UPI0037DCE40D